MRITWIVAGLAGLAVFLWWRDTGETIDAVSSRVESETVVRDELTVPLRDAAVHMPDEASPLASAEVAPTSTDPDPVVRVEIHATVGVRRFGVSPTPAADVSLEVGVKDSRYTNVFGETLAVVTTDAEGRAATELAWSAVAPRDDGKPRAVWVRHRGPGYLERSNSVQVPVEPGPMTVRLNVQPGVELQGRLLGPDGVGVAGRIEDWRFGAEGVARRLGVRAGTDGRFTVPLDEEGPHLIYAEATSPEVADTWNADLGTGISEVFEVRFDETPEPIEITVRGPGRVRGRVIDGGGRPAGGVALEVLAAAPDADDERADYARQIEWKREGRGRERATVTTDAEGRFEVRGLRQDDFHVFTQADFDDSPVRLTERSVASDGVPIELTLSRPHLAIHVRHVDGRAVSEAFDAHRIFDWEFEPRPEEARLLVTLVAEDAHLGRYGEAQVNPRRVEAGEFIVEHEPGIAFDVGILGGAQPWRPQRVALPKGAGRVDVDVVLVDDVATGTLLLEVADAADAPIVDRVRVRVLDPSTGVALVSKTCDYTDAEDWPMRQDLPVGEYVLLVEGHPWIDDHHGTLMRPRLHGVFEQPLVITPGIETRVRARLGAPARLHLRILGQPDDADRDAVHARWDGQASDETLAYWAPRVSLRLEREGRWLERPFFARDAYEGTSAAGTHLFASLSFGDEETTEPLTPGTFRLVAQTEGGRVREQTVDFVAGQTTHVTITFE